MLSRLAIVVVALSLAVVPLAMSADAPSDAATKTAKKGQPGQKNGIHLYAPKPPAKPKKPASTTAPPKT